VAQKSRRVHSILTTLDVLRFNQQQFPFTQLKTTLIVPPLLAPIHFLDNNVNAFLKSVTNLAYPIENMHGGIDSDIFFYHVSLENQLSQAIKGRCQGYNIYPFFTTVPRNYLPAQILITTMPMQIQMHQTPLSTSASLI
jgi:hypothetical protein